MIARLLCFLVIILNAQPLWSGSEQAQCLSETARAVIRTSIQRNRAVLIEAGLLSPNRSKAPPVLLSPLKTMSHSDSYHATNTGTLLDHSEGSEPLLDYNGGTRTFEGHKGTDFGLWPFGWARMDALEVAVVACAAGTIIHKQFYHFQITV